MDKSGKDFALVIQEFIDIKARQDGISQECNDKCLVAFEVSIVQSWVDLPRIVALIRNEETKQTTLFIFAGTRIADTVVSYLTTDKLIAVDEVLSCDSDSNKPTMLRIIGRDISSFGSDFGLSNSTVPSNSGTSSVSGKRQATSVSTIPAMPKKSRFATLFLGFDDATSANQFRSELTMECSKQTAPIPSSTRNTTWLDKYRADIVTPTHTPSLSHPNRTLRAARSFADVSHDATSAVSTSFSSTSCSSTSSESLYDDVDGKFDPIFSRGTVEYIRRSVSVPRLLEEEIEKGQDVATALTDSHWIAGDCSTTELSAPLPTPTTIASAEQVGSPFVDFQVEMKIIFNALFTLQDVANSKTSAVRSIGLTNAERDDRRQLKVSMPMTRMRLLRIH
ncbi:unnamed protein product [Hydatigera taeniaeformis]|uniref:Uncharacterized protein n=1 Tax=Hydatigena taeniaeformis TaxID=6205 RepID=A0A0R3WSN9_HYDTA|nr:unnamed protein product [Hydatigera taeniaeformis]